MSKLLHGKELLEKDKVVYSINVSSSEEGDVFVSRRITGPRYDELVKGQKSVVSGEMVVNAIEVLKERKKRREE